MRTSRCVKAPDTEPEIDRRSLHIKSQEYATSPMKRSKIARRIQPNRRIQFRQSGVAQAIAPGSTCSRHPYIGIQLAGKMSSRIPSMGQGLNRFNS